MATFIPRDAQKKILQYEGGYMAVLAVPGSGKTATIAALAAKIITTGLHENDAIVPSPPGAVPPEIVPFEESQVLVVTYQNAAVNNVRNRIRHHLAEEYGLPPSGFDVRTLHSLSNLIIKSSPGLVGLETGFSVLDQRSSRNLLHKAVNIWYPQHFRLWEELLPEGSEGDKIRQKLPDIIYEIGRTVITTAKNLRLTPVVVANLIERHPTASNLFLKIGSDLYSLFQQQVQTIGALDFDDLVWKAVDMLETYPDIRRRLRQRWKFVLEDEAQDSIPLQETLLSLLVGKNGNWVRVGDTNQSIMSTFTAADPKYLQAFAMNHPTVELPESGRCAPRIIDLANQLVRWTMTDHPLEFIRENTFNGLMIQPTQPDDPQQNPPDAANNIRFTEYYDRDEELTHIARRAKEITSRRNMTLAILVPTNYLGYQMAEKLKLVGAKYEELLQITDQSREVAETLAKILVFLGEPLKGDHLAAVYEVLHRFQPALQSDDPKKFASFLRSCFRPEKLIFPTEEDDPTTVLPQGDQFPASFYVIATTLAAELRRWLAATQLPVDQLIMTIAQDIFLAIDEPDDAIHAKLATAQKVATYVRLWADQNRQWRLPELAHELDSMISGKTQTKFTGLTDEDYGFEPKPGIITLTTMHRAKGLEWDLVYLVGLDQGWLPTQLSDYFMGDYPFLNGDPNAEAKSNLLSLCGELDQQEYSPTDYSHLEIIAERLRLLYVGITRAKRFLSLSAATQNGVAVPFQALEQYHRMKGGAT
ncbi:MAG: ATP-dependent helicase [Gemmatimonadetes bacterium]|nr:MAG: ATP-dependent helicase [Gemmatimonadota bacterium]